MLTENYFKCILVKTIYSTIKDTQFQLLLDVIEDLGLGELFEHTVSPLTITCINGNKILARGMDSPASVKSIGDISCVWYEEDIITEDAWTTVSASIRTLKSTYVQEIFTINPESNDCHYEDLWFYKRFFKPNEGELSFRNVTEVQYGKKVIPIAYTVHHSTYKDNRFITDEYIASLLAYKETDPYYYIVGVLGQWGAKTNNQAFYKNFNRAKHVNPCEYDPDLPLQIGFDFNVVPFCSAVVGQLKGRTLNIIDEISTVTPNNTTKGVCQQVLARYGTHEAGLFVYGDATNQKNDTRSEQGTNDFTLIQGYLSEMSPQLRVPSKNPPVVTRGQFINDIFAGAKDIKINIADVCKHLINDFTFGKEAEDGTKLKEKTKKDGITYEKYFHMADAFDYVVCELFKKDFTKQKNGGKIFTYTIGRNPINDKHSY